MLLDNIVTVVDYGLYVCVFFSFFCVAIVLFSVYSTVIGKLKIINKLTFSLKSGRKRSIL